MRGDDEAGRSSGKNTDGRPNIGKRKRMRERNIRNASIGDAADSKRRGVTIVGVAIRKNECAVKTGLIWSSCGERFYKLGKVEQVVIKIIDICVALILGIHKQGARCKALQIVAL